MLAPMLVQMERQIDREIAADNKANAVGCETQTDANRLQNTVVDENAEIDIFDSDYEDDDIEDPMLVYGPQPQIVTNDLKSLDEMVRQQHYNIIYRLSKKDDSKSTNLVQTYVILLIIVDML